ncbi:hypothetical protein GCM10009554_37220 [Kribbella koreensis]|uniref:AAA+ ATPase domain-containing protein n=1 Tax=Kribbella koreensis TaxID=57909 RepID=A0ABN1QKS1_9ACTN
MADTRPAGEGSERSGEPKVPAQDQPVSELARLIAESDAKGKGFWRRRKRKSASTPTAVPTLQTEPAAPSVATKPAATPTAGQATDGQAMGGKLTGDDASEAEKSTVEKATSADPVVATSTEQPAVETPAEPAADQSEAEKPADKPVESAAEATDVTADATAADAASPADADTSPADKNKATEAEPATEVTTDPTGTDSTDAEATDTQAAEVADAQATDDQVADAQPADGEQPTAAEKAGDEQAAEQSPTEVPAADASSASTTEESTDGHPEPESVTPASAVTLTAEEEAARPKVGVVYEPDESAEGFPLEYGDIIIGLPKQPGASEEPTALRDEADAELEAVSAAEAEAEAQAATEAATTQATEPTTEAPSDSATPHDAEPTAEASPGSDPETAAPQDGDPTDESAAGSESEAPTDSDAGAEHADGNAETAAGATADAEVEQTAETEVDQTAETDSAAPAESDEAKDDAPSEAGEQQDDVPVEAGGEQGGVAAEEVAGGGEAAVAAAVEGGLSAPAEGESTPDADGESAEAGSGDSAAGAEADVDASAPAEGESTAVADGESADGGTDSDADAGPDAEPDSDVSEADTEPDAEPDSDVSEAGAADSLAEGGEPAGDAEAASDGEQSAEVESAVTAEDGGVQAEDAAGAEAPTGAEAEVSASAVGGLAAVADDGSAESDSDDNAQGGTDSEANDSAAGAVADSGADSAESGADGAESGEDAVDGGSGADAPAEVVREKSAEEVATEQAAMALITALMKLRGALAASRLPIDVVGADEARQQQKAMLDQLDDYVLPRLVQLEAPVLAVVGGSTGAGKSTLVNSIIGQVVSEPGVLRPTTRSPVLIHNPADADWFTNDRVLPDMARSSGDSPGGMEDPGQIRLVAADTIPQGLAILDAPDIDSVVEANRDLATQLLAAADLWLFVTTAARYADAVPWEFLQSASDRSTAVAVVLDRAPSDTIDDITGHLAQMLLERGLGDSPLFSIKETVVDGNGMLASEVVASIKDWLIDLAADAEARSGVVRRTLQGAVTAMTKKTPAFAKAVRAQADTVVELRSTAESAYDQAVQDIAKATTDGTMLRGEVLARWQEFVGTGELLKGLQTNVGRLRDKVRTAVVGNPPPTRDLKDAIESGLESLLREHAAAGAERAEAAWQASAPGRQLLAAGDPAMGGMSEEFPDAAGRAVREWQEGVFELIRQEGADKRSTAKILAYGENGLGLALMISIFASTASVPTGSKAATGVGTAVVGQRLLDAVFGEEAVRGLAAKARDDLDARVHALMDAEFARYLAVLDQHPVDPDAPRQLTEAARAVEDCT